MMLRNIKFLKVTLHVISSLENIHQPIFRALILA